jgi:hypothetical protein
MIDALLLAKREADRLKRINADLVLALEATIPWLECHPDKRAWEAEKMAHLALNKARGHDWPPSDATRRLSDAD